MIAPDLAHALLRNLPQVAGFHPHDRRVILTAIVEWTAHDLAALRTAQTQAEATAMESADGKGSRARADELRHLAAARCAQHTDLLKMLGA